MTPDAPNAAGKISAPRLLPWLLGAVMLGLYVFTLNHWVTLMNVSQVASVSGWAWLPQYYGPLTFLGTYPLRWLPAAAVPVALNLFSAACATAALILLARSIMLLPHDRTELERQRERSDFSFLTGWPAWFPPILGAGLFGLQLTFWEQATSFTGETFDLLLFALILWQLLEYRLDEREGRLYLTAVIYGAGVAEDWVFIGFFPVLLTALIWLRGLDFFHLRFLWRLAWSGLAGTLFFLLLPLAAMISGKWRLGLDLTFWDALRPNLSMDWRVIKAITDGSMRHTLALMLLTTLLPLLLVAVRWSSTFGDSSRVGRMLAHYLFHGVNAVIFTVSVWVMFDPPFSPRELGADLPYPFTGASSLMLYYLNAVTIGYYCGYFLLVFGKEPPPRRRSSRPEPVVPQNLLWLCPLIVTVTLAAGTLALGILLYKNVPIIREVNDDTLLKYAQFTTRDLPPDGAILLCDSDSPGQDQPIRAYLIQSVLARQGRSAKYPVVDTTGLNWTAYHRYLHAHYPQWPLTVADPKVIGLSPVTLLGLLNQISQSNNLCYLNPSFGYYFEKFYEEPHGLVYRLKPLPDDTLLPPPLAAGLLAENEAFWAEVTPAVAGSVQRALHPPAPAAAGGLPGWLLAHLHAPPEANPNAIVAGMIYSRNLNSWGVQLQRAGELTKAARQFTAAQSLNPDNLTAGINLEFNRALQSGSTQLVNLNRDPAEQFGKYRNWNEVLTANGPFDEISFCFENGLMLVQGGMFRQALAQFTRVRQLAPDNLGACLEVGQLYLYNRLPDCALETLHDPLTHPFKYSLTESNSTGLNLLASAAHFQKNEIVRGSELIETEIARHPNDDSLLTTAVQAYLMRGLYTNALRVIDHKLARTPDDPQWLFGRGYANLQIGAYPAAIAALTRVLEVQTNDPTARFNRALAYLDSGRLDDARADYAALQAAYANSYQVAFGLAEVAWRQHATNDAIRNYQLYLANAPTNSVEAGAVRERLNQLQPK